MKFEFKELPGPTSVYSRPLVPVIIEGLPRAPQLCLLDTGALHNRFGAWVAEAAGIDLTHVPITEFGLGGFVCSAQEAVVPMSIGEITWEAPVWFCDPWPVGFHLLGQEGFFRIFDVAIRAAQHEFDIDLAC